MVIYTGIIILVSIFSPFVGIISAIYYFSKINRQSSSELKKLTFNFLIFSLLLFIFKVINLDLFANLVIGILLTTLIFVKYYQKCLEQESEDFVQHRYTSAIIVAIIPNLVLVIVKNLFFFEYIKKDILNSISQIQSNLDNMFRLNADKIEIVEDMLASFQDIMINLNAGIWILTIATGLIIGALLVSKKLENNLWKFDKIKLGFEFQFILIIGLMLYILKAKIIAYNFLLLAGYIYLIQGVSVISYYLKVQQKKWHSSHKFIVPASIVIFSIIALSNYIILLTISIIGLLDSWLDFRKISMKELS
ncbi:MAG: hypothetical protein DRH57_02820 [Candidatus Cloacimonadota bacterium]|nr:MAG: hypothetical protein DRH57_02820 [Candidatus Cloacimonadota bacterium]